MRHNTQTLNRTLFFLFIFIYFLSFSPASSSSFSFFLDLLFHLFLFPLVWCHADSLQQPFRNAQWNFIPPHAEGIPTTSSFVEENEEFCFIYSFESWIFLFRLGNHFFVSFFLSCSPYFNPLACVSLCLLCVLAWSWKGKKKKPRILCIIGPFLVAPEWKGQPPQRAKDYARQKQREREREEKKGRFILSFSLLRGRLDRSRGRQNNSWRLSKFPSRCWLLFCSKFHWAFFFRKSP